MAAPPKACTSIGLRPCHLFRRSGWKRRNSSVAIRRIAYPIAIISSTDEIGASPPRLWKPYNKHSRPSDVVTASSVCAPVPSNNQCRQLSLSTNCIDRIIPLAGIKNLKILSLGRNCIKKVNRVEHLLPSFMAIHPLLARWH